jgi:hypothetical protein
MTKHGTDTRGIEPKTSSLRSMTSPIRRVCNQSLISTLVHNWYRKAHGVRQHQKARNEQNKQPRRGYMVRSSGHS